jgi:RNA polymerase sigma factor (sigma-70 family)
MGKRSKDTGYLSLKEYYKQACAVLVKYGSKKFLKSEDNISYVMHEMMMADKRFDGRGSRIGYRLNNGRFAVKSLCSKKPNTTIYLNSMVKNKESQVPLHNLIGSKELSPQDKIEIQELIAYIKGSKILSDLEKQVILKYYIENTPVKDIVSQLQVSQQLVSRNLISGVEKLRWKFHE